MVAAWRDGMKQVALAAQFGVSTYTVRVVLREEGAIDDRPLNVSEQELVRLVAEGASVSSAAARAGVADSTARLVIRQWRAAQANGSSTDGL